MPKRAEDDERKLDVVRMAKFAARESEATNARDGAMRPWAMKPLRRPSRTQRDAG